MISQDNYIPLTEQEAINYIDNPVNRERLIQDIINLDIIENTLPVISTPRYGAVLLKNGDLFVFPISKVITMRLHYLHYELELGSFTFEKFHIEESNNRFMPGLIGFGIGLLGGLLIGIFGE